MVISKFSSTRCNDDLPVLENKLIALQGRNTGVAITLHHGRIVIIVVVCPVPGNASGQVASLFVSRCHDF